jgi:prepilin-type processing-associated H-X9-DG protein
LYTGTNPVVTTGQPASTEAAFSTTANFYTKLNSFADGTSNTLMVVESGGRPDEYRLGVTDPAWGSVPNSGWAQPNGSIMRGYTRPADVNTMTQPGPCMVNCSNFYSIYGLHPGGASVSLCDGSVRFLRDNLTANTVAALITRSGGEVITEDF